jgi:serpin B
MRMMTRLKRVAGWMSLAMLNSLGAAAPAENTGPLVAGNTAFAFDLYRALGQEPANLFFSPYNISAAMIVAASGAAGETEDQMQKALRLPGPAASQMAAWGAIERQIDGISRKDVMSLDTASSLWVDPSVHLLAGFLDPLKQDLGSAIQQADFQTAPDAARQSINKWVAEQTRDKIQNLLAPGTITPDTRMVIASAIYFFGRWAEPFSASATEEGAFTGASGATFKAMYMNQKEDHLYFENGDLQAVELSYLGGRLGMMVILPRKTDGLNNVERGLNAETLSGWVGNMARREVLLRIPKFKLETQYSLASALGGMGMTDAFSSKADFSRINGKRDLFISAVVHKAFIDVTEEGTEAAAATAVMVASKAMPMPKEEPVVFTADHPFAFLIRDRNTGSVLFLGRLVQP